MNKKVWILARYAEWDVKAHSMNEAKEFILKNEFPSCISKDDLIDIVVKENKNDYTVYLLKHQCVFDVEAETDTEAIKKVKVPTYLNGAMYRFAVTDDWFENLPNNSKERRFYNGNKC